jgi:hypothetical protein
MAMNFLAWRLFGLPRKLVSACANESLVGTRCYAMMERIGRADSTPVSRISRPWKR